MIIPSHFWVSHRLNYGTAHQRPRQIARTEIYVCTGNPGSYGIEDGTLRSLDNAGPADAMADQQNAKSYYRGISSNISVAPSRPTVKMTSPKVLVLKPASQYVK